MKHFSIVASLVCVLTAPAFAEDLGRFVDGELSGLVSTYKGIHAHPELSHHEEMTAALLATELRKAGFTVTEHVGKYQDGTQAYGVVAIIENGPGPRLLIRRWWCSDSTDCSKPMAMSSPIVIVPRWTKKLFQV